MHGSLNNVSKCILLCQPSLKMDTSLGTVFLMKSPLKTDFQGWFGSYNAPCHSYRRFLCHPPMLEIEAVCKKNLY